MPRVLIADDNPMTLRAIQLALEVIGFEVVATSDPGRVVELAAAETVDAAVLDIVMPDLSGFDLVRALRSNPATAAIPVVFLSGLGQGSDRVRGLREGADDYLVKPVEPAELGLRLERLIERRRAAQEAAGRSAERAPASPHDISAEDVSRLEAHLTAGQPLSSFPLGRYQLLSVLGEGATGTVFRGWDTKLHRTVALKTVRLSRMAFGSERSEAVSGLLREAVAAARVQHPSIVSVFDIVEAGELAFIIMEFVNGMTLEHYLRAGRPLDSPEVVPLGAVVARALGAAHAQRVIHHDLKPANVLLGRDGSIKVSDFGIAEFLSSLWQGRDRVFGTPGFVPPECLHGDAYDEKGDLFALGVTLYACLTGAAPFTGATMDETVRNTLELDPPSPRARNAGLSLELDDLVMSLIARERARRPASAAHVATRLERLGEQHGYRWLPSMAIMEKAGESGPSRARPTLIPTTSM
jgi:DNA-binding response OmpR family regulator